MLTNELQNISNNLHEAAEYAITTQWQPKQGDWAVPSNDEEDLMINVTRDGLEQAVQAVESGGLPVCIATEVAEAIFRVTNAEQDLAEMAERHSCDLLPSHILHEGDLVPAHIFMMKTK